jgi:carbon storage regulator
MEEKIMLVLTRRVGESIIIDTDIRVTVVSVTGEKVRIGIDAPPEIRVDRQEVHERRFDEEFPAGHPRCLVGT